MNTKKRIFKRGSKTYYNTSIFFPKNVRDDVFTFYAFVRTADDLVDCVPQKKKEFFDFKNQTLDALSDKKFNNKESGNKIIDDFAELYKRKKFRKAWVLAFLQAMESDLKKVNCKTLRETENYIYGSAEVIGLFMAKILDLEKQSYKYAMLLGKAMQYINFIRDIKEDAMVGRAYLPLDEAKKAGLQNLDFETISNEKNAIAFEKFLQGQIKRFFDYDAQARLGFKFIKKRYLVPVKTAQDMYVWTAKKINKNPRIVLSRKVKPCKHLIIMSIFINYFRL